VKPVLLIIYKKFNVKTRYKHNSINCLVHFTAFDAPDEGARLTVIFDCCIKTQNKGYYAVQGHLRLPISVLIESRLRLPISDYY